jgi:phenylacetate-CoA ligase
MAFIGDFDKVRQFLLGVSDIPLAKKLFDRSGVNPEDIQTYEDFQKIKPITKKEFIDMQEGNPASMFNCALVTKIFQNPGPIYNIKGEEFEHYRFYKALQTAGFDLSDKVINTFSYHMSPAGDMFDEALRKLGSKVFPIGPTDSAKGAEIISAIDATGFVGTRTYLFKCLEALGDKNTITKAYLIAEKMTEDDRAKLKAEYGVEAFQGYGTAEFGMLATECRELKGMHVDESAIFIEILEPYTYKYVEEGEVGEVVVTFMKPAAPFIRFATGDLSVKLAGDCSCGDKTGRIGGIYGRSDNSIKVKGVFVHQWNLEKMAKELDINVELVVGSDNDGKDVLQLFTSKENLDIKKTFREFFGLKCTDVSVNDKLENTSIKDVRERLKKD